MDAVNEHHGMRQPRFLAVDFFCGAGGTTRGLLDADGYVICGIDFDSSYRSTYVSNNKNSSLDGRRVRFLSFDMFPYTEAYPQGQQQEVWDELNSLVPLYRELAHGVPLLFVICAPCQSFTKFVQRRLTPARSENRDRDQNLLSQTVRFIKRFKPEMVISENVAGIRSGKYKQVWYDFEKALRDLGYAVGEDRICASRFGVAQFRRRSVMLALRPKNTEGSVFDLPIPECDPNAPEVSAKDAIDHLPPLEAGENCSRIDGHVCRNLTEINRNRLMSVKPGQSNWTFNATPYGDLSLPCHRRLEEKGRRGFGDVYTRLHPDRPAPTITTRFHSISNGRFGHFDENQVRGLSLREGAALQSFPDDYQFYGRGMDSVARMIGNAVPPKLSKFMAEWLLALWRDGGLGCGTANEQSSLVLDKQST